MIPQYSFKPLNLFAFMRSYLRVLADGNGIIMGLKWIVILRKTIFYGGR
jgi:hypothetical protein